MTTVAHDQEYLKDRQRREKLAEYIRRASNAFARLDMETDVVNALTLVETVLGDSFKLLVLGEFNTGKSTFINALLGADVLPSYMVETTAIINEIKWESDTITPGSEAYAVLHPLDVAKNTLRIQPVTSEILEDYVVVGDVKTGFSDNPYSHIELFFPLALCANRVEIIDSPGLNASDVRERITLGYLTRVDAVIFVMSALKFGPSQSELKTLEHLAAAGHEELFFVVNQWDIPRDRDKVLVRARVERELPLLTKRKRNAIFFLSALNALEGRLNSQPEKVEASGIALLEEVLHEFLGNERSRIKSARAGAELSLLLQKANRTIHDKRALLRIELPELQKRYDAAKGSFDALREEKMSMITQIRTFRSDMKDFLPKRVNELFVSAEQLITEWISEYPIQPRLNLNIKGQINDAVEGLSGHLNENFEELFKAWVNRNLTPPVNERIENLRYNLERRAEHFETQLEETRFNLVRTDVTSSDLTLGDLGPQSALERVFAAAGGFVIGGVAGAGLGAVFGLREITRMILPQMGAVIAGMIIGLPILPIMIVAAIIQGGITARNLVQTVKTKVGTAYKEKLREMNTAQAEIIIQEVDEKLEKMQVALDRGLSAQIDEVEKQVKISLLDKQRGEAAVKEKETQIDEAERELHEITTWLLTFLKELVAE